MIAIKRMGIWFAFAAWLMQISVFLTPIFSDHVSVGHGVCVELTSVVAAAALAQNDPHASHDHAQHALSLLHDTTSHPIKLQAYHYNKNNKKQPLNPDHLTPPSTAPPSTTSHVMDSTQCGFCLLLGHSVLPPIPDAGLEPIAFFDLAVTALVGVTQHVATSLRGLIPQSRAPPIYV